jgi:hypothetical protein
MIACSLCLGTIRWFPEVRDSLHSYAQSVVSSVQAQTLSADASELQSEVAGSPFSVGGNWEFTSDETWGDYQQRLRQRIAADFDLISNKSASLHFRCAWSGHIEHLYVERTTSAPLRVRCEYLQVNMPMAD